MSNCLKQTNGSFQAIFFIRSQLQSTKTSHVWFKVKASNIGRCIHPEINLQRTTSKISI